MIWVGQLPANGELLVAGNVPSSGNLIGELPGVPVRLTPCPAALGGNSIVIYCNSARPNEKPNQWNGGRENIYKASASRASEITVAAPPSEVSGWKQFTLRLKNPKAVKMIVIHWDRL